MIKKLFLILLFASQLFATNYYCDPSGSHTSPFDTWAKACTTFATIPYSSLVNGDTVFISGGVDSVVYNETFTPQCRGTNPDSLITFIAGKYSPLPSGHSGRVIIDMESVDGSNAIYINEYNPGGGNRSPAYLHIKGFELQWMCFGVHVDDDMSRASGLNAKAIIFDSLKITKFLGTENVIPAIGIWGECDSMIVQNCYMKTINTPGQTDVMHYNGNNNGTGHPRFNIIRNCFLDNTNQDPLAHNDAIQGVDGEGYWIYNNIIINDSVYSTEGGGVPFIVTSNDWDDDDWPPNIWFNNFAYQGGAWYPGASPGYVMWNRHDGGAGGNKSAPSFIFNNTIVSNGPNLGIFENQFRVDLFVNNICAQYYVDGTQTYFEWRTPMAIYTNYDGGMEQVDSIRNNLFWRSDSVTTPMFSYGTIPRTAYLELTNGDSAQPSSFADWVTNGGTGWWTNPQLVNNIGHEPDQSVLNADIKVNSPAIDVGEDLTFLQDYLTSIGIPSDVVDAMGKDIYGNARGNGSGWDVGAVEYQQGVADTTGSISFTSVNVTNATLDSLYEVQAIFTSADSTFHVSADSFYFHIGALKSYAVGQDTANAGDTLFIRATSPNAYSTLKTMPVTVSNNIFNWTITTKAAPAAGVIRQKLILK